MLTATQLYFFRDELEKEAVLTPNSALKAMRSKNKWVRKAGEMGARIQGSPVTHSMVKATNKAGAGAFGGEGYGLASGIASLGGDSLRHALKMRKGIDAQDAQNIADAVFTEYGTSHADAFLPHTKLISRGVDAGLQHGADLLSYLGGVVA